jgi:hypothetical protein
MATLEPTRQAVLGCLLGILAVPAAAEGPARFERLIPRGRIAAISDPVFVPAVEAEIDGDARVLGLVIEGQARAFSLNLLNRHEVVNDAIGATPYAAVW